MKYYATLCAVVLALEICIGQSAVPPLPDISSGLTAESIVNNVLSPVTTTLPLPAVPAPVVPTPAPAMIPATPDTAYQAIQGLPCVNLLDIRAIVSDNVTQVLDDSGSFPRWFPHEIVSNLNTTILNDPSKLPEHEHVTIFTLIAKITSESSDKLNKAVAIASDNIDMDSRIDADDQMTALLEAVPDAFKDLIVVSKACQIAKKAAVTAHVLQNGVYACEKALKNDIIPNFDKITEDLKTLSEKIDKDTDDDSSILPLVNEVITLYATVDSAHAANKDLVTNAGLALTKCIIGILNTAKIQFDNEYHEMKALVPSQMLSDALNDTQDNIPAPVSVAEPATSLPTIPVEYASSMPLLKVFWN